MDLSTALSRIPFLTGTVPEQTERLAGLTNINYLVVHDGQRFVVRLPGEGTAEYIDRASEAVAARSAADAGVNAEVLFFDADDGLMVTRFIEGSVAMNASRFANLGAVTRAGQAFRHLHEDAQPFAADFGLFRMIDDYKDLLETKHAELPVGYGAAERIADDARAALELQPAKLVPSHCDPLCENFLDTGEQMFIIDYEYAGNNDAMWDLADLSVEGGFTSEQDECLLFAYFGTGAPADQAARMVLYKALCDLLWTLWGILQHVNGNPADDFWAYAEHRFARCRDLMSTPTFRRAITELERQ